MKEERIKIIYVKPYTEPRIMEINNTLENMQALVGGNIEAYMPYDDEVAIICNEEGKLTGLPFNRAVVDEEGKIYDIIAGDFFLCSAPYTSENFESLNEGQVEKYMDIFGLPL